MALVKTSVVNLIEITTQNDVQVRFAKQVVDGSAILSSAWHRTLFEKNSNIDAIMIAVNADLDKQGFPAVSAEDVDRIKAHAAVAWAE